MTVTIVSQKDFCADPETIVRHVHETGIPAFITNYGQFIARIDPVDTEAEFVIGKISES